VAPRAHHKLLFKYYGPFSILERVGEAAYRLQFPPTSRIHPVLHVSQLKKALGSKHQRRFRHKGSVAVPQGLIQWSDQPDSLATWEDLAELQQRFPRAPAWGQAGFQGRGIVSSTPASSPANGSQRQEEDLARPIARPRKPSTRYDPKDWVTG
jgi:hypothetical protein